MIFNQRLRSLIAASLGVFIAVFFFKNISGKVGIGFLGAMLIGVSNGYLLYATKVDTAIFPALGMIAALYIFQKLSSTDKHFIAFAAASGVVLFIDVLFHQYMAFVCVLFVACLLLPPGMFAKTLSLSPFVLNGPEKTIAIAKKPGCRFIAALIVVLIGGCLTLGAFFYAGETAFNLPFEKAALRKARFPFRDYTFQEWLFLYSTYKRWGYGLHNPTPKAPLKGFTNAFISPYAAQTRRNGTLTFSYNIGKFLTDKSLTYNVVAGFTLFTIAGFFILLPALWRRYGRNLVFIIAVFVVFAAFFTYWEPRYLEFWIIPCILFSGLGLLVFNLIGEKLALFFGSLIFAPIYAVLFCFIAMLGLFNIGNYVVPYTRDRKIEEMDPGWDEDYYLECTSTYIYRHPEDPYKSIYRNTKPEKVWHKPDKDKKAVNPQDYVPAGAAHMEFIK